jgi:ribosomal protein S18 acetylase RimI-like enzyme
MTISILPFVMEAYDDVLGLWQQCDGIGLSDADSRANIQSYLERNPGMSFLAQADGRIVGAILAGHDGRRGYIHHLAVHPDFRRHGLGRQLVGRCLEVLEKAGIQKCHIFIYNGNADGIAFWTSAGWERRTDIGVMSKTLVSGTGGAC